MQRDYENNVWQGKKKQQIDDDGPVSKKLLKNQRKKINKLTKEDQQLNNYLKQTKKTQSNQQTDLKKKPSNKQAKEQALTQQLQKVYVECSKEAIRKCLQQADYNMQIAANLIIETMAQQQNSMLDVFEDNKKNKKTQQSKYQQSSTNSKNKNKKQHNQTEQQGYKILNEFYDKASQIEISGFQFEELFNQITQIIKQDQKSKGKGLFEINSFVQQCMSAKQTILVGLKDVFQMQDDIYIDENDPIYAQLQQYIYDLTQKKVKQQVIKAEDFPSLGEAKNKKKNQNQNKNVDNNNKEKKQSHSPVKQSIVNELQNQSKSFNGPITKNDFFSGSNNRRPVLFQEKNVKGIYNVDNQQQSEDALRGLHKQFNHVSIQSLKVAYLFLERNYNQCRIFLTKYYGKSATDQPKISIESNFVRNPRKNSFKKHLLSTFRKQSLDQIDEQLKDWTFGQIRDQIEHLYNLKQVFMMTCDKIKDSNRRKQLMRMSEQKAPTNVIRKLSKAARVKLIQNTIQRNPNYVDLHGHRQEQISYILQGLIASIKHEFDKGNEKVKYRVIGGRTQAILQVLTGKGRHSLYGKSILKPSVKRWCQDHNLRAIVNQDNVEIFIPLL